MENLLTKIDDKLFQFDLRVKTGKNRLSIEIWSDSVDIAVTSPPSKGRANREIIDQFAEILDIHGSKIQIVKGHRSSMKIIQVTSLDKSQLISRLTKYLPAQRKQ